MFGVFGLNCWRLLLRIWESFTMFGVFKSVTESMGIIYHVWCVLSELLGCVTDSMGNTFMMFVCSV